MSLFFVAIPLASELAVEILEKGESLKAGDKIYAVNMKKAVLLMQIGQESLEKGMNLIGSHIDSPRLDIKQNPVYENSGLAYLDTHYYGGIKKYQWVASPMALHGTVVRTDGTVLELSIGEKDEDPVVGITDLLVHLSGKQMDKKGSRASSSISRKSIRSRQTLFTNLISL